MKNTKMKRNVCRRFVLHNDFLPPTCDQHNWPFFAFGYYDGFSVGKNLFANGKEQGFAQLWNDSREETKRLDEKAMSQIVYGFRDESQNIVSKDELFWNDQAEGEMYPFIFFIMIQFEAQGRERLSELYGQKEQVENKYTEAGRYKAILYLTLENSDLLFIIRSKDYGSGAKVIDQFHRKEPFYQTEDVVWNVGYSFTVASIDKAFLREQSKLLDDQNKINHIYIYVTERYSGSIDAFFSELQTQLPETVERNKESILGYNDELIILSGITWDELLSLYKVRTGLMNHTNETYQKYLSGLTSIISLGQDSGRMQRYKDTRTAASEADQKQFAQNRKKNGFGTWAKKHIRELEGINETYVSLHQNMMQSLYYLVNSFSRFDNSPVRENLFFPASYSICQLLLMLKEMLSEDNPYTNKLSCYGDYQRFLSGLNLYAQNWVRSDRQFTQSLDFNIRIYNLPVILNAFYNAFMFYVKESLNDPGDAKQHQYEFLTCPGAAPDMVVEELFVGQSEYSRFCLVNIPENQTYNPELMLIMLCHEVAHFVGANVRNRRLRFQYLHEAFCRMVTFYYRYRLGDMCDAAKNEFWTEFERKLVEDVREGEVKCYTEAYLKNKFGRLAGKSEQEYETEIKKVLKQKESIRYHSQVVGEYLLDSMIEIIREKRKQYFGARETMEYFSEYSKCMDKESAEKRKLEFQEEINHCSMELIQIRPGARNLVNLDNMVASLIDLFKECLSDIIGIMVLHLTYPQYLEALVQNVNDQGKTDILGDVYINEMLIRAGLVCGTMIQTRKGVDAGYNWKGEDLKLNTDDFATNKLDQNIKFFIYKYLKNKETSENNETQMEVVMNYLLDGALLKSVKRYLFECRVTFTESMKNESKESKRKKAMEMFQLIGSDSVSDVMLGLHSFVDEYRNEIYIKMDELSLEA